MSLDLYRDVEDIIKSDKYVVAVYKITSKTTLHDAAWNIAIGQSVGNPNVRNEWETPELFENHSCKIIKMSDPSASEGYVGIAFPEINTHWEDDGVNHLICQLMGGHTDIDIVHKCRLEKLIFPESVKARFQKPKFGISGFRDYTKQYDKPLFGSIVKPKTGISPQVLLEMVKQMVDGGVDFIKEDEIMSSPVFAPLEQRVDIIANYLAKQSRKVVFCHTINCDPHALDDKVNLVHELGGNGVHINVFSSFGAFKSIRSLDLPLFLHYQSSGIKVFCDPSNRYSISLTVLSQLATMCGVDTIQIGMIGGYSNHDQIETLECMEILREGNTLPALSCGLHAGLIDNITSIVGNDYLANAGGAVHGHPGGTKSGGLAIRQAIDKTYGDEYYQSIEKWGKV